MMTELDKRINKYVKNFNTLLSLAIFCRWIYYWMVYTRVSHYGQQLLGILWISEGFIILAFIWKYASLKRNGFRVMTTGPYRFVAHPAYLNYFLADAIIMTIAYFFNPGYVIVGDLSPLNQWIFTLSNQSFGFSTLFFYYNFVSLVTFYLAIFFAGFSEELQLVHYGGEAVKNYYRRTLSFSRLLGLV